MFSNKHRDCLQYTVYNNDKYVLNIRNYKKDYFGKL